jgi:hypothetical protein
VVGGSTLHPGKTTALDAKSIWWCRSTMKTEDAAVAQQHDGERRDGVGGAFAIART